MARLHRGCVPPEPQRLPLLLFLHLRALPHPPREVSLCSCAIPVRPWRSCPVQKLDLHGQSWDTGHGIRGWKVGAKPSDVSWSWSVWTARRHSQSQQNRCVDFAMLNRLWGVSTIFFKNNTFPKENHRQLASYLPTPFPESTTWTMTLAITIPATMVATAFPIPPFPADITSMHHDTRLFVNMMMPTD